MGSATYVGQIESTANSQDYSFSSHTPASGSVIAVFANIRASLVALSIDNTGQTLTWTEHENTLISGGGSYAFWTAVTSSTSSFTVSVHSVGDAGTCCVAAMWEITSADTSTPVVQSDYNINIAIETPHVHMTQAFDTRNVGLAFLTNETNPPALTPASGWTEDRDSGFTETQSTGVHYSHRNSGETGSTITWGSATDSASRQFVAEIKGYTYDELERSASVDATAGITAARVQESLRAVGVSATADIAAAGVIEGEAERSATLDATANIAASGQKETTGSAALSAIAAFSVSWPQSDYHYANGYRGGYGPAVVPPTPPTPARVTGPRLSVLVDFVHDINTNETLPDPTWTEVVSQVRSVEGMSIRRGRQRRLDRVEAGTCTFAMNDPDGDFDPDNEDSPYFPGVTPMRRMRASALTDSETTAFTVGGTSTVGGTDVLGGGAGDVRTTLFDGLIQSWSYAYPGHGAASVVTVSAVDWLAVLSRETLDASFGITVAEARVAQILAERPFSAWVTRPKDEVSLGGMWLAQATYTSSMLDALGDVVDSDGGNFYCARDGAFVYRGSEAPTDPISEHLSFGDGGEQIADVVFAYDEAQIYNDITLTSPMVYEHNATDEASIARYGRQPLSLDTLLTTEGDMADRAEAIRLRYRDPRRTISRLDLSNVVSDWRTTLGADLWDRVQVQVTLPSGQVVTQTSLVEGIELTSYHPNDWRLAWWLSDAPYENLLSDEASSFETGTGGWTVEQNCSIASVQVANAARGSYVLAITPTTNGADVAILSPHVAVTPRAYYAIGANVYPYRQWDKGPAGIYGHVEVDWLDAAGAVLSTTVGDRASFRSWKLLPLEDRAPRDAAYGRIRVHAESVATSGSIWLDAVTFTRTR